MIAKSRYIDKSIAKQFANFINHKLQGKAEQFMLAEMAFSSEQTEIYKK